MLTLVAEDCYTYITNAPERAFVVIRQALRARPKGYQYMPAFQDNRWDGYISLLDVRKFPTGLLSIVEDTLRDNEIEYIVDTQFSAKPIGLDECVHVLGGGYELRDYQVAAVNEAVLNMRGILHMATNAGKTLIAAAIIQATGNKAVVVVPSRTLLFQTRSKLEGLLNIDIAQFGGGLKTIDDVTVTTVASLQQLAAHAPQDNRTLIIDECHHTRASSIFDWVFRIPGSYRFGMSGTPLTYDVLSDLKLIGATGPVIYTISNEQLILDGWSVPPIIKFLDVEEPQFGDDTSYHDAYRYCIVRNAHRNMRIAELLLDAPHPTLVMVNWIEHAEAIMELLLPAYTSAMVTGSDSKEDVLAKLGAFGSGDIDVLVATDVFGEGVDIPAIKSLVLAGGGKSHIRILQRVGRGLRTCDAKERLLVYDFLDDTCDYMLDHSEQRYDLYKEEGFEVRYGG